MLAVAGGASSKKVPGFKTAKSPYLVPLAPGASVDPIISAGDIVGGYQMTGIPDGLGAFKDGHDGVQVLMNPTSSAGLSQRCRRASTLGSRS